MAENIVIVDYQMGNLHSVKKKLMRMQVNPIITSDLNVLKTADKLILPGVGHFKNAMQNLQNLQLLDTLNELVLIKKKPILGICLGMQLFAKHSEEGNVAGLGWIDADVVRFSVRDTLKYKVPHTGWNQISIKKNSALLQNIPDLSEFYFVHSYHFTMKNPDDILTETDYEYRFTSALEHENIFGVQYHPEKSHDVGNTLFSNFVKL